ncbi:hypothetical protein Dda_5285 [Drechslerella dactyloides]|uniref:Uncharacterized protein n=1 Tax=Drechslerella dactyloides TaxID=74499 RepID=A0AAD6J084_DREDA|nr:hypothetical protein Dda_5285 [Drechslerella dactyloides]
MRIPALLITTLFLRAVRAQTDAGTNASTTTDSDSTSSTTTSDTLVTLAPDACLTSNLESCYNVLEIIAPTVYVILTLSESDVPESLAAEETIASGDPILTQTENILTATDDIIVPPTTAKVRISWTESAGTTCDEATITSTLTNSDDVECAQSTAAFFTPPPQVTKTRVFIKAREDDTQRKGTETGNNDITVPTSRGGGGGGGGGSDPNTDASPPTDAAQPTKEPVQSPTGGGGGSPPDDNAAPTENSNGSPTDREDGYPTPTGGAARPTENQTGTINYNIPSSTESAEPEKPPGTVETGTDEQTPSDSPVSSPDSPDSPVSAPQSPSNSPNFAPQSPSDSPVSSSDSPPSPTDSNRPGPNNSNPISAGSPTTLTSGRPPSGTSPGAGRNESGKQELITSYTTIAEVSNGSTRFVTSAVATMTRATTQEATGAASPNNMVKAELLLGAVGLAAVFGL